jgi:hypothetical protein
MNFMNFMNFMNSMNLINQYPQNTTLTPVLAPCGIRQVFLSRALVARFPLLPFEIDYNQ